MANSAVPGQFGAGARGQQQTRRPGFASPGDAVGIAGQERPTQLAFIKAVASFGVWPFKGEPAKLVGRQSEGRRLLHPPVECRQDVAGCRGSHDGTPAQAVRQERACVCGLDCAATCDQHRPQARVQWQGAKTLAKPRQPAIVERAQPAEQREGSLQHLRRRRFEPLERTGVSAPGQHVQHRPCQIDTRDIRLAMRTQAVALVPEPHRHPRPQPARTARALIGRVLGDALEPQTVEAALDVIARQLLDARIDDGRDAWHGERGLGDVGCQDHAAATAVPDRRVLRICVERPVQLDDISARRGGANLRQHASNLWGPGEKAEHVAGGACQQAADGRADRHGRRVLDREGVRASRHCDDWAVAEERRHASGIEGRRHHDDTQVVARAPGLPCQREAQIGVNASLVELVEHDRAKVRQQGVLLQARGQDSFGGDQQPGARAEAALEADMPADLLPKRPSLLVRDAAGDRSRRHAARLQQDDCTVVDQGRGNARRLPRARRGCDDHGAM